MTTTPHPLPPTDEPRQDTERRLINVLESVEAQLEQQNSLRLVLLRGAVYGLGTVLGATVLIALLGTVLAGAAEQLGILPIIEDYLGGNGDGAGASQESP